MLFNLIIFVLFSCIWVCVGATHATVSNIARNGGRRKDA